MAAEDEAMAPGPRADRRGKREGRDPAITAARIGLCGTLATAIIAAVTAGVLHFTQTPGPASPYKLQPSTVTIPSPHKHSPPSVTITSPQQGTDVGLHITATGTATHLRPDQGVAVLIQPYDHGNPTSRYWPGCSLAARGPGDTWSCNIQVGSATVGAGWEWAIWAVVVPSAESSTIDLTKQQRRRFTFQPDGTDIPHVAGTRLVHCVVTRS